MFVQLCFLFSKHFWAEAGEKICVSLRCQWDHGLGAFQVSFTDAAWKRPTTCWVILLQSCQFKVCIYLCHIHPCPMCQSMSRWRFEWSKVFMWSSQSSVKEASPFFQLTPGWSSCGEAVYLSERCVWSRQEGRHHRLGEFHSVSGNCWVMLSWCRQEYPSILIYFWSLRQSKTCWNSGAGALGARCGAGEETHWHLSGPHRCRSRPAIPGSGRTRKWWKKCMQWMPCCGQATQVCFSNVLKDLVTVTLFFVSFQMTSI